LVDRPVHQRRVRQRCRGATIDVLNPHDASTLARVAEAKAADVDRAVDAAQAAFPKWSRLAAAERGRCC